ncbi:MAG: hypothetical protein C0467_07120 [Planctomycetaceae bacterium]|nr:hypothetical protein [Planctomycetaceae bacterium]
MLRPDGTGKCQGTGNDGRRYIIIATAPGGITEYKTECGQALVRRGNEKGVFDVLDSLNTVITTTDPNA